MDRAVGDPPKVPGAAPLARVRDLKAEQHEHDQNEQTDQGTVQKRRDFRSRRRHPCPWPLRSVEVLEHEEYQASCLRFPGRW